MFRHCFKQKWVVCHLRCKQALMHTYQWFSFNIVADMLSDFLMSWYISQIRKSPLFDTKETAHLTPTYMNAFVKNNWWRCTPAPDRTKRVALLFNFFCKKCLGQWKNPSAGARSWPYLLVYIIVFILRVSRKRILKVSIPLAVSYQSNIIHYRRLKYKVTQFVYS